MQKWSKVFYNTLLHFLQNYNYQKEHMTLSCFNSISKLL